MGKRLLFIIWICSFCIFLLTSGSGRAQAAAVLDAGRVNVPGDAFSRFAGVWIAHGASLVLSSDGQGTFTARTYTWCGPGVSPPCDAIVNNQIISGYHEQLLLTENVGTAARGFVVTGNYADRPAHTAITLTLGPGDTLIYADGGIPALLCGPTARPGTCGA